MTAEEMACGFGMAETALSKEAAEAASMVLQPPNPVAPDVTRLAADLRTTVNNPDFSDVTFVCQNGVKVYASRIVLAARSPVLRKMLTNGMLETSLSEIPLSEISSRALLPVLEYLCTGEVVQTKLTIMTGFEVISASRFLDIPVLEAYVFRVLRHALDKLDASNPALSWCFSQLAGITISLKALPSASRHELGVAKMVMKLAEHLMATFLASPSSLSSVPLDAMNIFLEYTESRNKTMISLMTYLRLRSTLLWAASTVSNAMEKSLEALLPDDVQLVSKFGSQPAPLPTEEAAALVPEEVQARLNEATWSALQLQCIHPQLLVKVLEPLNIIPGPVYLEALKFQALHSQDGNHLMRWDESACNGYEVLGHGFVLRAGQTAPGIALATMPLNKRRGICAWEVFIENPVQVLPNTRVRPWVTTNVVSVGVAKRPRVLPMGDGADLLTTWHVGTNGLRVDSGRHGSQYCHIFGESSEGYTMGVQVDMGARTCAFLVDGRAQGVAFDNLPFEELYPSIKLVPGCRATIKLITDPRFL